jgi:hypothetical protein
MQPLPFTPTEQPQIDDAQAILRYLDACPVLIVAAGADPDQIRGDGTLVVPIGVASDGLLAWPLSVAYYVREHQLAPPEPLLRRIRESDYRAPSLSDSEVDELRGQLRSPTDHSDPIALDDVPDGAEPADDVW